MRYKVIALVLGILVLAPVHVGEAQQPQKIPRIGYLGAPAVTERTEAFRQGLRDLGYVDGKNIVIEWRHHGEKLDRLSALATELCVLR